MKTLKNILTLVVTRDEMGEVEVTSHYVVASDDLKENRACEITLTGNQIDTLKSFAQNVVVPQIKTKEKING